MFCNLFFCSPRPEADRLFRRYWNDDAHTCIEKQCSRFAGNRLEYKRCLFLHCRHALVTVPRDLDEQYQPNSGLPSNMMDDYKEYSICVDSQCGHHEKSSKYADCIASSCLGEQKVHKRGRQPPHHAPKMERFGTAMDFTSCLDFYCTGLPLNSYADCVEEKCAQLAASAPEAPPVGDQESGLVRKRRVNDITALCISKYCGTRKGVTRNMCIYRQCSGRKRG